MDDGSARIELRRRNAQSLWAVVDQEDYPLVSQYRWRASLKSNTVYVRSSLLIAGGRVEVMLHRFLLAPEGDLHVDHIDHDGLNNRRSNLRVASVSQNRGNTRKFMRPTTSLYKGVHRCPRTLKWQATCAGKYQGLYPTQEEAARAYDAAALERYGEFACLNFPDELSRGAAS